LRTRNVNKCFGMSIGPFFYDDALIRFHIEDQVAKLLDVSAKPARRTAAPVAK
jgi:hypothetical protein